MRSPFSVHKLCFALIPPPLPQRVGHTVRKTLGKTWEETQGYGCGRGWTGGALGGRGIPEAGA